MIDGHIHYADSLEAERLRYIIEAYGLSGVALQCIPKGGKIPVEEDAFSFKRQSSVPVYIFGGLDRRIFSLSSGRMAEALPSEIDRLMTMGCDGIKMLDGKPGVRRRQNLRLDAPNYDKMFDYAQRTQFPILYHINDPIEFWYRDRLPQWAVEKDFFYGDGTFPHKFEIDEETFGFLRKHPNLNLCIPHFFFISDQPGLCCEMLDRYPNLFFDITPGWEMFENFAKDREYWRSFFSEYSHKILFGTDTFSDHWRETVTCLRRVMETDEPFVAFEENCVGLDLPEKTLRDIYFNNYHKFIRRMDKKINVDMVLEYADTLYDRIPVGENRQMISDTIDYLKAEIGKFR